MGKLIRNTNVKVDGQPGPLGKGVPLTKAAGPGGMLGIAKGHNTLQTPQVPGFKGMINRGLASGRMKQPGSGFGDFRKLFQQRMDQRLQKRGQVGGFWGRAFKQMQQKQGPFNPQGPGLQAQDPQGIGPQSLPNPQPTGHAALPGLPKAVSF